MNNKEIKDKTISGFIWRLLQNAGTQVVSFVLSLVLARILSPEDYGLVAMVSVFTSIALVFVNTGFSSAIVQRKEITQEDLSSVYYFNLVLGIALYCLVFFSAPFISEFYHEERLTLILRIQALSLIISSFYSVQQAIVARNLQFKKSFYMSLAGVAAQTITGLVLALNGAGVWAIVVSQLMNNLVSCIVIIALVNFKPSFTFSIRRVLSLFYFSSKILLTSLLDTVFNNIRALIIGRVYSSEDLAFYNRGSQFPTIIMNQIDGSMTTVLFSSLSKYQSDWSQGLPVLRRALKTSLFVCAPLLAGLCAVADPMVRVLLTDKWVECIPYVRMSSLICLFWPITAGKHALNARGYSGISLSLNLFSKGLSLILVFLSYKISVFALVASSLIASIIGFLVCLVMYKKYLNYGIVQQLSDILPSIVLSAIMGFAVYGISLTSMNLIVVLAIQIIVGIIIYCLLSWVFNRETFTYCLNMIKGLLSKRNGRERSA